MSNKGKKRIATGLVICVVASGIGLTLMGMAPGGGMGGPGGGGMGGRGGGSDDDQAAQKTVVEVENPTLGSVAVTGSFVGTVEPGRQVTVYPKASGEILEANYSVGDTVEAGSVLFRIDSTSVQLDIAQAQANLSSAQAKAQLSVETAQQNLENAQQSLEIDQQNLDNYVENVENGLNSSLLQAQSNVRSAEISLQQASADLQTARKSYNDYINDEWDGDDDDSQRDSLRNAKVQAELKMESAQATLENAKANLAAVQKQVEEQEVTAENSVVKAESDIKSAETNIKSAELGTDFSSDYISIQKLQNNLDNYTMTAPISGVVEQKYVDVYDTVSTGSVAYVISNKDLVSVSFDVTESALEYLSIGNGVTVEKNGETCTGTVTEIATMVDASSGLYTVKASVENAPFDLHSGSSVKLYVETQKVEDEMVIPIDAVYYDNGSPSVFVFEQNTARKVEVTLGISDASVIHVQSGLSMTDQVIVTYSANLYDGAEVYLPGTAPQSGDDEDGEQAPGEPGKVPADETQAVEAGGRGDRPDREDNAADTAAREQAPGGGEDAA